MVGFSIRHFLAAGLCIAMPAVSLAVVAPAAGVPPTSAASAPVVVALSARAPAGPLDTSAVDFASMASPFAVALRQTRWLAGTAMSSMFDPLPPQLLVAAELPVRFVPGTIETTPVTVTNTTAATLPSTLRVSYWWAEIGTLTPINGHNAAEVPLGQNLAPGATVVVQLPVRTPIQSDNGTIPAELGAKRLDFDLYVDLKDGANWWSATHEYGAPTQRPSQLCGLVAGKGLLCPDRLIEDATSSQIGLEKFLSYAGEDAGAGTAISANLSSGNAVWSYAPIQNPSIGPSTFVRMTYNSMDVSDPGTGYGWSVQASTLTRLGSALSVPSGGAPAKTMTFVDGDGTTHEYKDGTTSGSLTTFTRPGGVHLDLLRNQSQPVEKEWVFTRPDGTRFYYSQTTGLPTSVVDTHGNTLAFTHDVDGQLTQVTDAKGRTTLTLGWANKHLAWMRDISGRGVQFGYSPTGQVISIKDGGGFDPVAGTFSGLVKTFGFGYTTEPVNKNNKLVSATDPRGNTTNLAYYPANEQPKYLWWPKRITDRRGHGTAFAYSDPDANLGEDIEAVVTDENGATPSVTTYRVDGFGRTETVRDANANAADPTKVTTLLWDGDHNVIKLTAPNGTVSTWDYDDITGYPTMQRDAVAVANNTPPTTMAYDQLEGAPGKPTVIISITSPQGEHAPSGRTTTFGYSQTTGDLLSVTDPLGHPSSFTYNTDGTLRTETDARGVGHTTSYPASYHDSGNPETITDALENSTTFGYDARGNVVQVTNAASEVTTAIYDAFGRPTSQTSPHETGSTRTATTGYDLNDNAITVTDPTGAVTTTTYTPMDLPATDTLPANSEPATSRVVTYAYDVLDRVEQMTSPAGRLTQYGYDRLGQTLTVTMPFTDLDGVAKTPTTRYTYDLVGNVTKVENPTKTATADPADFTSTVGYDDNNRQTTATDAAGNTATTLYDTDGTVKQSIDPTGVSTTYVYDLDGRTTSVTAPHGGAPRTTTYGYDVVDNQIKVTSPSGRYSETVYDQLSRPIETRSPFDTTSTRYNQPTRSFVEYDNVGRIKRQSDPTWATTAAQVTDWTTITYHPSGDVKTTTDPWNLITTYAYNKNSQQTQRVVKSTDDKANRTMTWGYWPDGSLKTRGDNASSTTPAEPLVVDNDTPGTTSFGTWSQSMSATTGMVGTSRRVYGAEVCNGRPCNELAHYAWPLKVPTDGKYSVAVSCPQQAPTEKNPALYTISSGQGSTQSLLDQRACASGYANLTTVPLSAGTDYKISVRDGIGEPNIDPPDPNFAGTKSSSAKLTSSRAAALVAGRVIVADAVKLTKTAQGRSFEYAYDRDGIPASVRSLVDGVSRTRTVSTPDGLGRIHQVEEFHGVESIARRKTDYRFDIAGKLRTVIADGKGSIDNQATSRFTLYTYNSRELVETVESGKNSIDPDMRTTTYTYNARGQRVTVTKGNGNVVTRTYFEDGPTKSTVEKDGTDVIASHELTYNLEGDRKTDTSKVASGDSGGGFIEQRATYAYTPARQLESVTKTGANPGKNENFQYDAAGNTTCQVTDTGPAAKTTVLKYTRNRLTQTWPGVASCDAASPGTAFVKHDYDSWGRASEVRAMTASGPGPLIKTYSYDGFDRLIADRTYPINGANDVTTTTVYDAFDRTMAQTSQLGGQGPKTTRYVYLGLSDRVANEEQKNTAGAWTIAKAYSYGPGGEHLSMVDSPVNSTDPAKTLFYGTNPHGDVETLTDETGATKASYRYEAFGQLDKTGTTGLDKVMDDPVQDADVVNPYRFNSMRVDPASGQYDMGFRNYDPSLNRFLTRDSYNGALDDLGMGMDPWTVNRYAFAGGNPVSFIELDGHRPIEENGDEVENPQPYFDDTDSSFQDFYNTNTGGRSDATLGGLVDPNAPSRPESKSSGLVSAFKEILNTTLDARSPFFSCSAFTCHRATYTTREAAEFGGEVTGATDLYECGRQRTGKDCAMAAMMLTPMKLLRPVGKAGIYIVHAVDGGVYVGQSRNIARRLAQHVRAGKFTADEVANAAKVGVAGGKAAREVAEQSMIDAMGGIDDLINYVNPIGPRRFGFMPNQPYWR